MKDAAGGLLCASLCMGFFFAAGCSFGKQPATRLYVLTALSKPEGNLSAAGGQGVAIGVGPVLLPQYVNRPQIVTGNDSNELRRAAFAQWAEPLEDNFTRVLAENLAALLSTARVASFPWHGFAPVDYQVVVGVTRFLGEPGGEVSLDALWSIVGKDGRAVLVSRQSSVREQVGGQDYEALAAALSRAVAALSRDIAGAIAALPQSTATRGEKGHELGA
ncbi:MAG: PqiC family protein [Thermodesulfobacteriota bacterium]